MLTKAEVDITDYQRCIGSLMYLMICTYPNIIYLVGVLSQYVTYPGKTHIQAIKCIFHYLYRTSYYKLKFQSNDSTFLSLEVFVDFNQAKDWMDRKSISGFIIILDQGAVSWGSKKQISVSLSMVEAKFVVALIAVRKILWHRSLLYSLDMTLIDLTYLHINNCGALELIKSGQINDYTKYIKTKFRHIYDCEKARDISGVYVATEDQMADIMTKSLGAKKFVLF